jgi:oligopeptide/dipeptide ABC transporter, ATP-binding protein, C-terminal domain
MDQQVMLDVSDLHTYFYTSAGTVKAVDGVSFQLDKGKTLGIVGESGSGKSITAMSILRLVPSPPGKIVSGSIRFGDRELLKLSNSEMRKIRGNKISMIFQDPMTALNPCYTIGNQIAEVIALHQKASPQEAMAQAIEMMAKVQIPEPAKRANAYPHQFSGGMRQRVMIAMALACRPDLLIADEPTTALDVTVQAQILRLMRQLQQEFQMSIILITHDLGVVAEACDHVMVMYAGNCVEYADVHRLFDDPRHPYTWGLLASRPALCQEGKRLESIEGSPPNLMNIGDMCGFAPRCKYAQDICRAHKPVLQELAPGHLVACHFQTKDHSLSGR